ncbi:EF-hand domain-containing protein [Salinispira pacifica]
MEDRRRNRKKLSQADQAFLNRVRELYNRYTGSKRKLRVTGMKELLGLRDGYLARRIFAQFDGDGKGVVEEADFLKTVIALILSDDSRKLDFIFSLHDANGDGSISRPELGKMITASLRQNQITVSPEERKRIAAALFKAADRNRDRRISGSEFKALLRRFPEVRSDMVGSISTWFGEDDHGKRKRSRFQFRAIFRFLFYLMPHFVLKYAWLFIYLALNAYLFLAAQQRYAAAGANIYLQIARGAGACLDLNGALILIPMMRTMLSRIRNTPFASLLPLDQSIEIHRFIGEIMFLFALVHTGAHIMNYSTLAVPIEQSLLHTAAGLTGVILLGIFVLMWIFARKKLRRGGRFEFFYYTHLLYLAWLVVFLVHAPSYWMWALVPLVGWGIELLYKQFFRRNASFVTQAAALPYGVTALALHRPDNFTFNPGDYLFLRIPSISRFEWHPFTISSGPERSGEVTVHVRGLGDWTKALHKTFSRVRSRAARPGAGQTAKRGRKKSSGSGADPQFPLIPRRTLPRELQLPVVFVGPYGTPSARALRSRCVVLVGAGIGVTPFASILQSIAYRAQKREKLPFEKAYFVWLNRGQRSFEWFSQLLDYIEKLGLGRVLESHIYMTDARINAVTGLAKIGMELDQKRTRKDLTTGLRARTNFGRPDWDALFSEISKTHGVRSVNVFFCGPEQLGRSVKRAATRFGFRFRKENF